ncbi:SigB/SigF/SigG family RNA polymerase sigma factor [Jannaschia sp. R86511]|uniref:SigB/SigF/SigG family RNA polymerase sigma factor n=1 Tax=Jannaschia sp. R86511 TaxID=3093853 RepID=UPI0036D3FCB7
MAARTDLSTDSPDTGPLPVVADPPPGRRTRQQSGPDTDPLLERLAGLPEGDPERNQLRDTVVTSHLPLVHHIARRFAGRGEPHDDVVQVGTIGLIKAVDRYEPGRGVPFAGYAVPTVTGEIRRYFRDRAGTVRLPRRVQEVQVAVTQSRESLTHELGRTPTVEEVAHRSGLDTDTVLEVLESAYSLTTVPLDVDNGVSDSLGEEDVALDEVLTRETLRPVLAKLEPRERRIIALRFVRGMSQAQIAEEVGISQMHVSRLLSRTLTRLRADMTRPDPAP